MYSAYGPLVLTIHWLLSRGVYHYSVFSSLSLYCLPVSTPPILFSPYFNFSPLLSFPPMCVLYSPHLLLLSPSIPLSSPFPSIPLSFPIPSLLPLVPSLPAHLDLSGSSTGDDLSLLPFCKEPCPARVRGCHWTT